MWVYYVLYFLGGIAVIIMALAVRMAMFIKQTDERLKAVFRKQIELREKELNHERNPKKSR